MKLQCKIDKTEHLITLELKDSEEHRKIIDYMEWQLLEESGLYSMNARPLFLDNCKKIFENGKTILAIKYLNDDEGLLDILSIFRGHFGIHIKNLSSVDMVEESTEFSITNKERFESIIGTSISSDFFATFNPPVLSTNLSYYPKSPLVDEEPTLSLSSLSDKEESEKSPISSDKKRKVELLEADSIDNDKYHISEKSSETILTAFKEKISKKIKPSDVQGQTQISMQKTWS